MQICDTPDATEHFFHPLLRMDVGRERRGGDETERPRERTQARWRFLTTARCVLPHDQMLHFRLISSDGHRATPV